jgi:hypothetical protein
MGMREITSLLSPEALTILFSEAKPKEIVDVEGDNTNVSSRNTHTITATV